MNQSNLKFVALHKVILRMRLELYVVHAADIVVSSGFRTMRIGRLQIKQHSPKRDLISIMKVLQTPISIRSNHDMPGTDVCFRALKAVHYHETCGRRLVTHIFAALRGKSLLMKRAYRNPKRGSCLWQDQKELPLFGQIQRQSRYPAHEVALNMLIYVILQVG